MGRQLQVIGLLLVIGAVTVCSFGKALYFSLVLFSRCRDVRSFPSSALLAFLGGSCLARPGSDAPAAKA